MPIYRLTSGLAAARAGDYAAAAEDFRLIAEAGDLPEAWLDLADAYVHLGRHDLASEAWIGRSASVVSSPSWPWRRPACAPARRSTAGGRGDCRRARACPSLVGDPWWASDPERAAAFGEAEQIVSSRGPAIAWQLALYAEP